LQCENNANDVPVMKLQQSTLSIFHWQHHQPAIYPSVKQKKHSIITTDQQHCFMAKYVDN